jgi:hypothetical protein
MNKKKKLLHKKINSLISEPPFLKCLAPSFKSTITFTLMKTNSLLVKTQNQMMKKMLLGVSPSKKTLAILMSLGTIYFPITGRGT